MKTNRRNFLQLASGAALATVAMPLQSMAATNGLMPLKTEDAKPDENYWKMVRKQFPLNKNLTYLNNGTMGPSPYYVIESMQKGMMEADVDGSYGGWENTCKKLGVFVSAHEDEIALTRNVTEGINIVAQGLPLGKGDEVIMTTHEHVGNAFPWINIQKQKGIVIRTFTPASTADETLNRIAALINKRTKVLAVPHIPCTQGQVLPAKRISSLGKEKGLFVFIDGAHGPGMLPLDLHDMGCDVYASCCHKWMLGPKGTGFLYVRKEFIETLQPKFVGAGSDNAKWNMATTPISTGEYALTAHRYYGGTYNAGLYKGVDAAIEFIDTIGMKNINERILSLAAYAQKQLLDMGGKIEMLTPTEAESRGGVIGFRIKNADGMQFYNDALKDKIRIRYVAENGLNSLRVSTHIYNNTEEIDRLMEMIRKV